MLIDTHCHLTKDDYQNLDDVIKDMDGIMITSGCNMKTNLEVVELVEKYDNVYGTLGIHPEDVDEFNEDDISFIEKNLNNPKIVAIGEIGLDYHWTIDNKDIQKDIFMSQLSLAEKYNKPVVIHSRDAIQDTYDILKKFNLKGSIHCFNSSVEMAKEFIKLGYKIGVSGTLTFKNSIRLQNVIKSLDINDIILETDSPYLSPEPFRGSINNPKNVYYTALKLSNLKNMDIKDILNITNSNAVKLFDLKHYK